LEVAGPIHLARYRLQRSRCRPTAFHFFVGAVFCSASNFVRLFRTSDFAKRCPSGKWSTFGFVQSNPFNYRFASSVTSNTILHHCEASQFVPALSRPAMMTGRVTRRALAQSGSLEVLDRDTR
jgi:hypothetical protein